MLSSLRRAPLLLVALLAAAPGGAQTILDDGFEGGNACAFWQSPVAVYQESFANDGAWPSPWVTSGDGIALSDVSGGEARLRPVPSNSPYPLARMAAPVATRDVEVTFTLIFEQVGMQGVGFYVRSSGGFLDHTNPPGAGYAVFVEKFRSPEGIGVWREVGGQEVQILGTVNPGLNMQDGVRYRVRFRVEQESPSTTRLSAKVWPEAGLETVGWTITATDSTPSLQGISGGIAIDGYNANNNGPITTHTRVDDLVVTPRCNG